MKSPVTVKLQKFADVELAYRRLRDDIASIEGSSSISQNTEALLVSMRRVLVQAVLADRYVGVWIDGSLEEAETISYTPISTLAELHTIVRGNLKGKFQLTADIDATADCLVDGDYYNSGAGWEPIGTIDGGEGGIKDSGFQGIFDGGGYKITGLLCNRSDTDYQGLFGYVGLGGIIKNLEMENVSITGRSQLGGICGGTSGLIYNCHTSGTSSVIGNYTALTYSGNVGGIVGDNDGTVRLCSAVGEVRGLRDVGGVSGDNDGLLQYCWFIGDVYCSVIADAGLISGDNKGFVEYKPMADMPVNKGTIYGCYGVGTVQSFDITEIGSPAPTGNIAVGVGDNRGGKISASWASGTVSGKNPDVAGFVGNNDIGDNSMGETKDSIVSNCYALATVTPEGNLPLEGAVGGFVGKNKGGQIYNCFCASTVIGTEGVEREHSKAFCGNNSNTELLGILENCYFDKTLYAAEFGDEDELSEGKTTAQLRQQATFDGWDFESIWSIVEGISYPTLPDMPEASDSEMGFVDVFPIQRIGVRPLTGDVRPKIVPGHVIFAETCEDDVVRTPIIVEDRNFPVGRDDIKGGAVGKDELGDLNGNDIAGEGLRWDESENLRVNQGDGLSIDGEGLLQVNQGVGLDINDAGELVVDPSEFNGDGLDYDPETGLLSVDLTELPAVDLDFTDMVDDTTIGFDNPKAYVAGKTYEIEEKCSDGGINYKSLQDANTGNTPASSPTWWESMGGQNVLKVKEGLPGDGLSWSTNGHLQVNQGVGLDINDGSGALDVDLHNSNPINLVMNGNFEHWSAGDSSPPDGWSLAGVGVTVAKESAIEKYGDHSAKLTRNGSDCLLYCTIHGEFGISFWKGKTVTFSCWVYASVANTARITIEDGVASSSSAYHSGSPGWERLTVTYTINDSATLVAIDCYMVTNDTSVYFDGAMVVMGELPYAFSPHILDTVRDALGAGLDYNEVNNLITVDPGEFVLTEARIFELANNRASDSEINGELAGYGAAGVVTEASSQVENGIYGRTLDADAKQAMIWSGFVPNDYKAGTDIVIKARWCLAQDGDEGATVWRSIVVWNKVERGDATVIGGDELQDAVDNAVGAGEAQRTMHTLTLATIATLESRDLITVALMRDATHANDTCTKEIMVLDKIWAEYTADKL